MNILHKNKTINDPDRKLFFVVFIGQASKQFDYNIVTFFQFSKDNEQLTQKQISPLRSQMRSLI